jgi:hypothetical protein
MAKKQQKTPAKVPGKKPAKPQAPQHTDMPPFPMEGKIADEQSTFTRLTAAAAAERDSERVFLASKLEILRTHPGISEADRVEAENLMARTLGMDGRDALARRLAEGAGKKGARKTPPVPGGVGYGMFYTNGFRSSFARGTSFYYEIVCPHQPGGNVNTWLYLTAMNRAQRGVEAFVSYQGQNDTRFKVFDWARSDQWQTNIPFANLTDYLRSTVSHAYGFQVLLVWNSAYEIGANRWRNEVLLHNRAANRWDLIYRYDYDSTTAEQTTGFTGTWAPIVETFQNPYQNTRWLGFLNTMLISRNANGQWGNWALLTSAQSTIRNDGQGFSPLFLDPNYSFVVKS